MYYTNPTYKIMVGMIKDYAKVVKRLDILDYGCGSGYLLSIVPDCLLKSYCGIETSLSAIVSARRTFGENSKRCFKHINTTVPLTLPNKKVDIVIAIGVLQYMDDNQIRGVISEASKVLKKNGRLLISCVTDHALYKYTNLYGMILPNRFINRKWLVDLIKKNSFKIDSNFEKGLIFSPLFYHNIAIIFDVIDKIIFRNKGTLGFFGKLSRGVAYYIASLEYLLPFDFGYTLYIEAIRK